MPPHAEQITMKTAIEIALAIYSILGVASSVAHIMEIKQSRFPARDQALAVIIGTALSVIILVISFVNLFI